jgi:hypothetical protein
MAADSEDVVLPGVEITCSELLCFLQNKSKIMAFDDLVSLCADFYKADEIEGARVLLSKFVSQRLAKHKGQELDKSKRTLVDILKICLDPAIKIPLFYAVDLSRLPPVGVEHVDSSALIQEVSALRAEVRALGSLRLEIDELRKTFQLCAKQPSTATSYTSNVNNTVVNNELNLPVQSEGNAVSRPVEIRAPKTAAQIVSDSVRANALPSPPTVKKVVKHKPVVGSASTTSNIKAALIKKPVDLFVSRLSPEAVEPEITDYVKAALDLSTFPVDIDCVKCEKLVTKYDSYASFHITICVDTKVLKDVVQLLMSSEAWPEGVLIRRYFTAKHG